MIDELVLHDGNGLGQGQRQTLADQVQPRGVQELIKLLAWEMPAPLAQQQNLRCGLRLRASFVDAELTQNQVATRSAREKRHGILISAKIAETAMAMT